MVRVANNGHRCANLRFVFLLVVLIVFLVVFLVFFFKIFTLGLLTVGLYTLEPLTLGLIQLSIPCHLHAEFTGRIIRLTYPDILS